MWLYTLRSYVNSRIKWLMDLKYISPNKLLMIYGFMGAFTCTIVCIITTFAKCTEIPKDNENVKDFYDYICKVKITSTESITKYFDSYIEYFEDFNNEEIIPILIKIILGSLFFFLSKYYSILVIKYLTPVHLTFSIPIYNFAQKAFVIINTLIRTQRFMFENPIRYIIPKLILDFSTDILSILGFLIYLEIIELNFCGLDLNLRNKIMERGMNELMALDKDDEERNSFNNDEQQNDEESKENSNKIS